MKDDFSLTLTPFSKLSSPGILKPSFKMENDLTILKLCRKKYGEEALFLQSFQKGKCEILFGCERNKERSTFKFLASRYIADFCQAAENSASTLYSSLSTGEGPVMRCQRPPPPPKKKRTKFKTH